jgi:Carbohydrate-selective porin, OprB family/S-layer homology domain
MAFSKLSVLLWAAPGLLCLGWMGTAAALTGPLTGAAALTGAIADRPISEARSQSQLLAQVESTAASLAQINRYIDENPLPVSDALDQVTSVSQLSDVKPTDWAFQALQSLVERYGCIVGYPDQTYRGHRALSRYEFAAGLNACMDRINELLAAATADLVRKEDLLALQKLQEEFASELAVVRGRVDALEGRTATLEKQQFSTTTKLVGEAIFNVSASFSNQEDGFGNRIDNQTVLQDRVRLNLLTSFTGKDLLTTRLAAGNREAFLVPSNTITPTIGRGTAEGVPAFAVGGSTDNAVVLDRLDYTFPVGERLNVFVAAAGGRSGYYVSSTVNPYFEDFDGGHGALSAFGQESPIYRIGGGAGAAFNFAFDPGRKVVVSGGYLAANAASPLAKNGLFDGDYSAFGQLTVTPTPWFQLGLTYVNAYHTAGNSIFSLGDDDNVFYTGTVAANALHTGLSTVIPGQGVPAVTNSYGMQASFKVSPQFVINAFGGFTDLKLVNTGRGEIWYYGIGLAFPDLFKRGNVGGIIVGREPYLGSVKLDGAIPATLGLPGSAQLQDLNLGNSFSLHIEAFYKMQLTPNIAVTPGIVWITNPDQDRRNSDFVIGTLRTTFSF